MRCFIDGLDSQAALRDHVKLQGSQQIVQFLNLSGIATGEDKFLHDVLPLDGLKQSQASRLALCAATNCLMPCWASDNISCSSFSRKA